MDALHGPAGGRTQTEGQQMDIETMIDTYGDDMLRLCLLYLGERQLAEDAFQTALIRAWRSMPGFRGESSVKTWLSRITVNVCRDTLRSGWFRMRKASVSIDALTDLAAEPSAQDGEVTQAVLALPGRYREIIVLYYFEDMTLREIADALRIPINTASTRLRRGRALLGDMLKGAVELCTGKSFLRRSTDRWRAFRFPPSFAGGRSPRRGERKKSPS